MAQPVHRPFASKQHASSIHRGMPTLYSARWIQLLNNQEPQDYMDQHAIPVDDDELNAMATSLATVVQRVV